VARLVTTRLSAFRLLLFSFFFFRSPDERSDIRDRS
jgi:hypothetical protein